MRASLRWHPHCCFYKYLDYMKAQQISKGDPILSFPDTERYVLIGQKSFEGIHGQTIKETSNSNILEGLVKITYKGKCVYRKCIGRNISLDEIQMGYRTKCELKVDYDSEVSVESANWFAYYWYNSDSYFKHPFRIAVISAIITILSFVFDVISFLHEYCICNCNI